MPVFTFVVTGSLDQYIPIEAPDSYAAEMRFYEELYDSVLRMTDVQVEEIRDEDGNRVESTY